MKRTIAALAAVATTSVFFSAHPAIGANVATGGGVAGGGTAGGGGVGGGGFGGGAGISFGPGMSNGLGLSSGLGLSNGPGLSSGVPFGNGAGFSTGTLPSPTVTPTGFNSFFNNNNDFFGFPGWGVGWYPPYSDVTPVPVPVPVAITDVTVNNNTSSSPTESRPLKIPRVQPLLPTQRMDWKPTKTYGLARVFKP